MHRARTQYNILSIRRGGPLHYYYIILYRCAGLSRHTHSPVFMTDGYVRVFYYYFRVLFSLKFFFFFILRNGKSRWNRVTKRDRGNPVPRTLSIVSWCLKDSNSPDDGSFLALRSRTRHYAYYFNVTLPQLWSPAVIVRSSFFLTRWFYLNKTFTNWTEDPSTYSIAEFYWTINRCYDFGRNEILNPMIITVKTLEIK